MPRMTGKLLAVFAIVGAVCVGSMPCIYLLGLRVTALNKKIIRHNEVIRSIDDTLITALDAETGQRGYLLSGEEPYLAPYDRAVAQVNEDLKALRACAAGGELPREAVVAVEAAVKTKLAELADAIEQRKTSGLAEALVVLKTGRGKRLMEDVRERLAVLRDGKTAELEDAHRRRDNATWLRTTMAVLLTAVSLGFLGWAYNAIRREMTRTERAAAAAAAQRELLAVTLASIGDAVIVTDEHAAVTFLNPEAERLTGWLRSEAVGRPLGEIFRIINEHSRQPVESPVEKVLRLGMVVGLANHTLLVRRDGAETPIDDSGAPVRSPDGETHGVVLVFRDFSRHRAAERMLRESEEMFRTMANAIPQLAWMARPDGHIFWYNDRWYAYTGTTLAQMEGWGWQSIHDPKVLPDVLQRWRESIATGQNFEMEFPLRGADGGFRWFLTRVRPLRDAAGRIVQWFGTNTDIEDKREAEASLQDARLSAERAKAAAEHANAAKDRFIAVLSHELRTPLMPVLSAISLLQRRQGLDADARETLQMMQRNVELEARLIDDLLDLTRIARGRVDLDRQPVQLGTIIDRSLEVCRPDLACRRLDVKVEAPSECLVYGDVARLQQVVWNLIKNAIKFTPDGGRIAVHCRIEDRWAVLEVVDSGIGIESDALERIFDAFEQGSIPVAQQFGGLGLGLAICRSLVELHGGSIEAQSAGQDRGAVFRVRLPLHQPAAAAQLSGDFNMAPPISSPDARVLRVLLVEDHPDTARIVQRILEMEGHKVAWVSDLASALDKLTSADGFDLLISDLGLPDGSGLDLMREMQSRGVRIPGIALSGYGQDQDVAQSRAAGFVAHLVKPMNMDKLLAAVQDICSSTGAATQRAS